MARLPLLRSPHFSWVAPDVAAISVPGVAIDEPLAPLLAAIRAARVGGSFWGPPPPLPAAAPIVVRAFDGRDLKTAIATFGAEPERLLMLLPAERWATIAARACHANGIAVAFGDVDPWPLLEAGCTVVAVPDDEWALLAAIAERPTFAFDGTPLPPPDLAAVLLRQTAYRDCFDGRAVTASQAVAQLAAWRAILAANADIAAIAGISWWKRKRIGQFLWAGTRPPPHFARDAKTAVRAAAGRGAVAVWPSRTPEDLPPRAAAAGVPLVRIEDGFVRSVGLGTNFHLPSSIVIDAQGIYFDPTRPSDLESLLARTVFTPDLTARAERLIARIVAGRIGKYGVGAAETRLPARTATRLVLVAAQVEDDLSVLTGGGDVAGNLDLVRRARAAEPDAEIWFRPHPDVESGHRLGAVDDAAVLAFADRVVREGSAADILATVDAVHVLTSLIGFEALLRHKEVVAHGQPFYAGWGLTRDLAAPLARRGRTLSLAELVAGALILYPRYLDPETGLPCPPEIVLDRFATRTTPRMTALTRLRTLQGRLVKPFSARTRRR